jgi:lipoate-protein ligase B
VLIRTAVELGVPAARRPGWTGAWTEPDPSGRSRKLASIGVAVKRWVTLHGFALNVAPDLTRFEAIKPCGLEPAAMTSLSRELGRPLPLDEVSAAIVRHVAAVFERAVST